MRKTLLATVAAALIGSAGTGMLMAYAQPAPPPAPGVDGALPPPHPGWGGLMHHWGHGPEGHGPGGHGPGTFALVFRQEDRNLSPSDVKTIAEGFLLWNGNHDWKVTDVAPAGDNAVGFALATREVVARFTIDRHTGKVTRTG
jgi:hypothetical protein